MENNLLKKHFRVVYRYNKVWTDLEGVEHIEEVYDEQAVKNAELDPRSFNVVKTDTTIEYDRWANTSYEALVSKLIRAS